jgi:hypothetical protein
MRRWGLAGGAIALGLVLWAVAASVWTGPALASISLSCTTPVDSGGCATVTIPAGVSSVTIEVWGARGGAGGGFQNPCSPAASGGLGGYVKATYAVSPGDTLSLYVGAKGGNGDCGGTGGAGGSGGAGGVAGDANGGAGGSGSGPENLNNGGGGGGGGETDVRLNGTTLADRIVAAGGGGGTGGLGGAGGTGGGLSGGAGANASTANGGAGASRTTDGGGGASANGAAGGSGSDVNGSGGGGGGGGGLCGGGGGDPGSGGGSGAGGGGGSGFVDDLAYCGGAAHPDAALVLQQNGVDAGNTDYPGAGKVVLTYAIRPHTRPASNVLATSATLSGYDSNSDTYHFEYGTDMSYGTTTPDAPATAPSPPTSLDQRVTGLQPSTTYHYRIDSADGGPGDDIDFTTLALPHTGGATGVTASAATLQGTDANSGESYHFEYGTDTSYGKSTPTATNNGGTLTAPLANLHAGTTYHFRLVGDAGAGVDATFTTLHFPVTVPAKLVTDSSAKIEGIDSNSGTAYHFEWGTTTAYGHSTATKPSPGDASTVSATLTGLQAGTTYHYRIVDSVAGPARDVTFATTTTGSGGGGGSKARDLILGLRGPAKGTVGGTLRYVATIGNIGTAAVRGAKLKLTLRGGRIKFVSAPGCTRSATTFTCALPKIAAGKAVRVKIAVRETKAAVLAVNGNAITTFTDPTPKNNRASTRTTVK